MFDPFIISSIILAICFVFILISNHILESKIIKYAFLILSLIFLTLILIFDNNYIYSLLKSIITYLYYPNYLLFVTTILISIIILIYTLIKKKIMFKQKVINYLFFGLCFSLYIIFLRLDININLYSNLYKSPSIIITRITTISFLIWLITTIIFKLIKRSYYEK